MADISDGRERIKDKVTKQSRSRSQLQDSDCQEKDAVVQSHVNNAWFTFQYLSIIHTASGVQS